MELAEPILHVDMDAFFVEVERRRDPGLRGRPVVVGGLGRRGVVTSASYEARAYGVHSAMPTARARRLCPGARFLPNDHRAYRRASAQVFEVLRSVTPRVEQVSLDEAFLDVRGLRLHFSDGEAVGTAIRRRLRRELDLPASVGVAPNKLLAKLASRQAKPDGLLRVRAGRELAFLHPLAVRELWGVGEATHAALELLGVGTVGDLARVPRSTLERRLGESLGSLLYDLARGRDDRPVVPDAPAKSVSVEETYQEDLTERDQVERELLRLCDRLADRLSGSGSTGRTVHLKARFADFTTITRSVTLDAPTGVARDLYRACLRLAEDVSPPVRLLGVGVSGLEGRDAPRQLAFDRSARWDDLARAVELVRSRYGGKAVRPARLVGDEAE